MRIDAGLARTARPTVLVVGATGYLGRHIVAALRRADYPVRALARDPHRLGFAPDNGIEVFVGQVTRPETLAGLCDGVSIVVSTLGVRSLKRRPTPWEVDYQGNLNVLTLAEKAGVQRFIFAGVLHGEQLRHSISVVEPRERFIDTLQSSGVPWIVLRPTGFFNDMEIIFDQARRGRVIQVGDGATRMNPIHPNDLADAVIHSIEDPATRTTTVEVGGPEVYSYAEIAQMAFRALGKPPHTLRIAPGLVDGVSALVRPFNPTAAGFLRFFRTVMTTDMVAPPTGHIHLADFYAQLASGRAAGQEPGQEPTAVMPAPGSGS
jgi:uncharacterized protein YbjT (DUF2867 family)